MSANHIAPDELRDSFQQLLRQKSETIAAQVKAGQGREAGESLWREIAELGWLGLSIDEDHGGLGLGVTALAILYEELGRCLAPVPLMPTMLAADAVSLCGSPTQKEAWLPAIASGELRASLALPVRAGGRATEPRGTAFHVLQADVAQLVIVPVATSGGGVKLALVSTSDSGVTIDTPPLIDLTRTLCMVRIDPTSIVPDQLMSVTRKYWDRLLDHACLALACDSVGGADRILERTVEYMGLRKQFGVPIGSFQALKHRAATWKILLESVRALTEHAAQILSCNDDSGSPIASAAKYSACDAYTAIAGDAVQLHGGIGFTWEHDCHLFLKRARLNAELFGSTIQHKERIAGRVFATHLSDTTAPASLLSIEDESVDQ